MDRKDVYPTGHGEALEYQMLMPRGDYILLMAANQLFIYPAHAIAYIAVIGDDLLIHLLDGRTVMRWPRLAIQELGQLPADALVPWLKDLLELRKEERPEEVEEEEEEEENEDDLGDLR
jgi:hypothetical protein